MAENSGEQLIHEMDSFLSETAPAEAEADAVLPFETVDDYLNDPGSFGDMTKKLLKKVTMVFALAVKFNRHSPEYLKSCSQLERGIKYLGSCCLQKYALEQHKHSFPNLGQLNAANLYTMAPFTSIRSTGHSANSWNRNSLSMKHFWIWNSAAIT